MSVDYRETLVVYLRSETRVDAAKTLGISYCAIASRLKNMKRAGVEVPDKSRQSQKLTKLEVDQLNNLVRKYKKEQEGHA